MDDTVDTEVSEVKFSSLCPASLGKTRAFSTLEHYMEKHQFIEADKKKVRDFLKITSGNSSLPNKDRVALHQKGWNTRDNRREFTWNTRQFPLTRVKAI